MNDLRLSFQYHDRNTRFEKFLRLATHLGYLADVKIEAQCAGSSARDGYCEHYIYEYDIRLDGQYAVEILQDGLEEVLRRDEDVQKAMNTPNDETIALVQSIDW